MIKQAGVWTGALALAVACALTPAPASAMSYVMMRDDALLTQSQGVAKFEVVGAMQAMDGDTETRYLLKSTSTLAGKRVAAYETLVLPGTFNAPNVNRIVPGVPKLRDGQSILLFFSRQADGTLASQQLSLGLFGEAETAAGKIYVRYLTGGENVGKGRNEQYASARDAAAFDTWIRDYASGLRPAENYLVEMPQDVSKYTFSVFDAFNPDGPARWFQFDSNQTLPWTAAPDGQANMVNDEFVRLQQALAAWTNDATSRISMSYAGTAANGGTGFNGHVKWNDPGNEISGSFNCNGGGTLAIGGSFASSNGQTFAGQTWYPRSQGFVTVQDGAGCALDRNGGADMAELLLHEIGHAIAFGHSCGDNLSPACNTSNVLNEAVMRAFLHADGRGATLGVDDIAAAAVAYPAPGGGGNTLIFKNGFE